MSVTVVGVREVLREIATAAARFRTALPARIRRRELPYWQERGWQREGTAYTGAYQTPYGSFRGLVEDRGWGHFRFYILELPDAVRHSSHGACFQPRGRKGYHVHMARRPHDVGSGILTIERLITEAHRG